MVPQTKRMRLGTKSCTECRRRKVKCTFDEGRSVCQQCTVHSLVCQSQQPSPSDEKDHIIHGLSQFVSQFESRMGNMQGAIQNLAKQITSPPTYRRSNLSSPGSVVTSTRGPEEETGAFTAAPLLGYIKRTLNTKSESQDPQPETDHYLVDEVTSLIPNRPTLVHILEYTEDFWSIWPLARATTYGRSLAGDFEFPDSLSSALSFIDRSLGSADIGVISRCLVWICLCLQELPKGYRDVVTGDLLNPQGMIAQCLIKVEAFYQISMATACNLDFVEALVLRYELHIFMGRPSKAWKSTRAGIDNAMLLGLHRPGRPKREQDVWETLWIQDRHLSLFLGLPYTVPKYLTSNNIQDADRPLEKKILGRLAIISGHITDRDHLGQDSPYSSTARIIEELDEVKAMIPREWDSADRSTCFTLGQAFIRRAIKLFYFVTSQMLHLPYVRMAAADKRYEYNRSAAFEAAEGAIRAYQNMRALEGSAMSCDFLDFHAFSAAAIIAADLLSQKTLRAAEEEQRLWNLIVELGEGMKKLTEVLDCVVVEQSVQVLEYLYAARHGAYAGPDDYEVTIPYFGRMKISRPQIQAHQDILQHQQVPVAKNVVELESNAFTFRFPSEFQTERELTEDWTNSIDLNFHYDWQGVFEFNGITS